MQNNLERLNIELIEEEIKNNKISYFESLESTNSWLLSEGKCGDICISEAQTQGRGRRGNTWETPKGNISFSLCYCFNEITKYWSLLGLVVGIAIAEALEDLGISGHGVKWPNDIFWNQKKLGGILLETIDQSRKVVIGIGLNVALPTSVEENIDQPITSLEEIVAANSSHSFSREILYIRLIERVNLRLNAFKKLKFDEFIQSWNTWDILLGKQVVFNHQKTFVTGEVVKIDDCGRLGVVNNSGELCFYTSADIKLINNGSGN